MTPGSAGVEARATTPAPDHTNRDVARIVASAGEVVAAYHAAGRKVIALHSAIDGVCSCKRGAECPGAGKHPILRGWQTSKGCTSYADVLATAEGVTDEPNIGMQTGATSRVIVIDVDGPTGEQSMKRLQDEWGAGLEQSVRTGGGGWHIYVEAPEGVTVPNSASAIAPGIDIRGENGMVVVPPSVSAKGAYTTRPGGPVAPIAQPMPEGLRGWLRKPEGGEHLVRRVDAPALSDQDRLYHESGVRNVLDGLRNLPRPWHDGAGWDLGSMQGARDLVALGNTLGRDLRDDFMAAAPHDDRWDERAAKWAAAVESVGDEVRVRPPSVIEEMFNDPALTSAPAAPVAPEASGVDEGQYRLDVSERAYRLRVQRDARDLVRSEEVAATPPPEPVPGQEFMMQADDEPALVDGLIPSEGKFLIAAAAKAGKTTTAHHVVRCLLAREPLFGHFPVRTDRDLRVHLIDNEMGSTALRTWLRKLDLGADHLDRLTVHSMLGYASTLDPTTEESRRVWAQRLRGADVVLIDCLSPFMQAVGLDENHDAGRWLVGLDELMTEAGVRIWGVLHHTGHDGERARGDSKILGWAFQLWTLSREGSKDDDEADDAPRFLKARGRIGSIPSGQIEKTAAGLRYVAGATRAKVRAESARLRRLHELMAALQDDSPEGGSISSGPASQLLNCDAKTARDVLKLGVRNGVLRSSTFGPGRGATYSLVKGGGEMSNSLSPP